MKYCPSCGQQFDEEDNYCDACGIKLAKYTPNHCSNDQCEKYSVVLNPDAKYCKHCGSPTVKYKPTHDFL